MRPIAPGEHITFDYAMCDTSSGTLEFACACGSEHCRKWCAHDMSNIYICIYVCMYVYVSSDLIDHILSHMPPSPLSPCRVGQDDWQRSELWGRYQGYFAPHVQRAIDRFRQATGSALETSAVAGTATLATPLAPSTAAPPAQASTAT